MFRERPRRHKVVLFFPTTTTGPNEKISLLALELGARRVLVPVECKKSDATPKASIVTMYALELSAFRIDDSLFGTQQNFARFDANLLSSVCVVTRIVVLCCFAIFIKRFYIVIVVRELNADRYIIGNLLQLKKLK